MPRFSTFVRHGASFTLALALCGAATSGAGREDEPSSGGLRASLPATAPAQRTKMAGARSSTSELEPFPVSPPGSGAGTTGFVSAPVPAKAKRASARATKTAVASEAKNAEAPETTGALPLRGRARPDRKDEDDPYAAEGIAVGSFIVKPSVELTTGHDDNPFRVQKGRGSRFSMVKAKVETRSQWSRHELATELRGDYSWFHDVEGNDRPEAEAKLRGRIDVSSNARIELEAGAALTTEAAGTPDSVTSARRPPEIHTYRAAVGYVHRFNRLEVGVRGELERSIHQDARLISGGNLDLSDRDYVSYGMALRGSYEVTPGIKPFVEAGVDRRVFDREVDLGGIRRGSDGWVARAGMEFERPRLIEGEVSIGFARRHYEDPALDPVSGLIFDSSLVWHASALTKVRLKANSEIGETTLLGASGVLSREASIAVDHAFRRWLIGTVSVAYGSDQYRGTDRRDRLFGASAGLTYHMSRYASLKGEVRRESLRSNAAGSDYTANIVFVGLTLQR